MLRWLIPTLVFALGSGCVGVVIKLATRTHPWPDLVVWTGVIYIVTAGALLATGRASLRLGENGGWVVLTGVLAVTGMLALYLALEVGEVTKVIPITAGYPLLTFLLGAIVLSERVTLPRVFGAGLVVAGIALITATASD